MIITLITIRTAPGEKEEIELSDGLVSELDSLFVSRKDTILSSPALTWGRTGCGRGPRKREAAPVQGSSHVQHWGNRDVESSRPPREDPEARRSPGRRGADTLPAFVTHCVCVEASGGPGAERGALRPA